MFTWLPMPHLPQVPEHFVQLALEKSAAMDDPNDNMDRYNSSFLSRKLNKDGEVVGSRYQYAITLGEEWEQWVRENIMTDYWATGVRVSAGQPGDTTHGAHVDAQFDPPHPTYKLYYLLDRGGEDATTSFYWENGESIERDSPYGNPTKCDDYSRLTLLESVKFPMKQWVLLNTSILHGVENITGSRINLTVICTGNQVDFDFKFKKERK